MNWFQRHALSQEAPDLILHIGAGRGTELDVYRQFTRSRIVLVEPQADLAAELANKCESLPKARVIQAAVAKESGERPLHMFDYRDCSSLSRPTGLLALFPGLSAGGVAIVNALTLSSLISEISVSQSSDNWLVVDAPGAEPTVLRSLSDEINRELFTHVFLRAGKSPLYESCVSAFELLQALHELGYEQVGCADTADPDIPAYHLQLNESLIEAKAELSTALSVKALREADLRELQERYAAVVKVRDEQHHLLLALQKRLGSAVDYLRRLGTQPENGVDIKLVNELIRSLVGGEESGAGSGKNYPRTKAR